MSFGHIKINLLSLLFQKNFKIIIYKNAAPVVIEALGVEDVANYLTEAFLKLMKKYINKRLKRIEKEVI